MVCFAHENGSLHSRKWFHDIGSAYAIVRDIRRHFRFSHFRALAPFTVACELYIKKEVHDVAILHDVFFAFDAEFTCLTAL